MRKYLVRSMLALPLLLAMAALTGCSAMDSVGSSPVVRETVAVGLDIVATAATALIGIAGTWALAKIGQNKNLANLNAAIQQVVDASQLTVGELQQTVVAGMKAAAENGKLTDAQIINIKQQLLFKTKEKLTMPAVQLLEAAKLDVNALIRGAAEDMINQMHVDDGVLVDDVRIE